MHALRSLPAHLPDLRRHPAGAQQPARPHRPHAGDCRWPPGADPRLRRGNVLLSRLSGVHDGVSGGGELRRVVRARARRGGTERRAEFSEADPDSRVHLALAIPRPPPTPAGRVPASPLSTTRSADVDPPQRDIELAATTTARARSDDTSGAAQV